MDRLPEEQLEAKRRLLEQIAINGSQQLEAKKELLDLEGFFKPW